MDYQELVDEAFKASQNAYVPYSHFRVGACLLLKNGQKFMAQILKMRLMVQQCVLNVMLCFRLIVKAIARMIL